MPRLLPEEQPALVYQTHNTCGGAVVAMLTGQGLHDACTAMRKFGKTSAKDLNVGVAAYNLCIGAAQRLHGAVRPGDGVYVARIHWAPPCKVTHWVLLWFGKVLDPAHGLNPIYEEGSRFTSVWPVTEVPGA